MPQAWGHHGSVFTSRPRPTQTLDASARPGQEFLRIERQLFTAISGGILMEIRIETCPLTERSADPDIWHRLSEIILTMPSDEASFKCMLAARDSLVERMRKHRKGFQ